MPDAAIIAGPNGAGKTTFARQFTPLAFPSAMFLNADEIQRERPAFATSIAAGRELLRRLEARARVRGDFVVETTLSSRLYARRIPEWRARGYHISLHFIELPSADMAVARVARRVAAGGHDVPQADIRRRFDRGKRLFHGVYKPLADSWYHWFSDNAGARLVAHG